MLGVTPQGNGADRRYWQRLFISGAVVLGHAGVLAVLSLAAPSHPIGRASNDAPAAMVSLVSDFPSGSATLPPSEETGSEPITRAKWAFSSVEPLSAPNQLDETGQQPDGQEARRAPDLSDSDTVALAQFDVSALAAPSGAPCHLTSALADIFAKSPEVARGLAAMPATQRSVANAVMLWDGQWPKTPDEGGQALLRALLVKAVSSAPAECLTQVNQGPVLILVPERQTTVVLAIGSGTWRWGDLTRPPGNNLLAAASVGPSGP